MRTSIFTLVFLTVANIVFAQQIINLNDENASRISLRQSEVVVETETFGRAEAARIFHFNPTLQTLTNNNRGDKLLLDFFENEQFVGVIQSVTRFRDGSIGISAKIEESDFGFCYIVITRNGISINAELPERNKTFFAAKRGANSYLSRYNSSAIQVAALPCANCSSSSCTVAYPPIGQKLETSTSLLRVTGAGSEMLPQSLAAFGIDNTGLNDAVTIRVLVPYTAKARNYAKASASFTDIESAILMAFVIANQVSVNSGLNITFDLAYMYETDYVEKNTMDDLYNLQGKNDGYMDEVHELRRQHNADIVMLIPSVSFTGGVSYVLNSEYGLPNYAFGLSRIEQLNTYTMIHEIGHILGATHHKLQGNEGLYSYSYGWRGYFADGTTRFATVMTYESFADGQGNLTYPRIPYFSDPNVTVNGAVIGATDANVVLTLKRTKRLVSLYSDVINTSLTDIIVSDGTLSPAFNPDITDYTLFVDNYITDISITGMASYVGATVSGSVEDMPLNSSGNNIVRLTVKSHDKSVVRTYTVHIIGSCTSYESLPVFAGNVSSPIGTDDLNLNLDAAPLIIRHSSLQVFNLARASGAVFMYNTAQTNCYQFPGGYSFYPGKTFKFKVTETGDYIFIKSAGGSAVMNIYTSETPSCESFIASSAYWTGSGTSFSYYNRLTATLTTGTEYYLTILYFSDNPTGYWTIDMYSYADDVYTEFNMPEGIAYTYIAVCDESRLIKHHHKTADFRILGIGNYTIYGLSYSTVHNPDDFIGQSLDEISNCITPSATSMSLMVTGGDITTHSSQPLASNIILYPNPVNDYLFIESDRAIKKVEIYNLLGKIVFTTESSAKELNISGLSAGLYLVRVQTEGETTVHKIEKK